jgi:DNA-binding response OmpR family regulator
VLVVDDEPQILRLARIALEQIGLVVLTASDGREAVEVFERERSRIDLVILDRSLPKLSGERVLRELRALDAGVRVVVSSGESFPAKMEFPGVRQFLGKPYTIAVLRQVVEEALRGR